MRREINISFIFFRIFIFLTIPPNCRIYQWRDTYMDVVTQVMPIGVTSVTVFEHRQSTIIVFTQIDAENPWIGSEVYEFKDSSIIRTQFLSTTRPTSVHHYIHGDFNFILMINDLGPSDVLCWDGRCTRQNCFPHFFFS